MRTTNVIILFFNTLITNEICQLILLVIYKLDAFELSTINPIYQKVREDVKESETKAFINIDSIYPCNGSYIKTNGTTCGLKEIILGRCHEYQYVKRGLYSSNQTNIKNCTRLYELFESAVRYKPYCQMNMSTYEAYFQFALEGVESINRAVFWSGTYTIAHIYSAHGQKFVTLEDTLAAAMLDGLAWCGQENEVGFDYFSCPNYCPENKWADVAFWGLASQNFAQRASGEIFVILNGSRTDSRPAFRNGSFFSDFELPNFRREGPNRVTKINVLLLHSPDLAVVERCGEKSLKILESLVQDRQFNFSCADDPDELISIMCGDQPNTRECLVAQQVLRKQWNNKLYGTSGSDHHIISLWLVFVLQIFSFIVLRFH